MTSTTDATRHPDVSEIADLTEDLLPPSRAEDVRGHLADCGICSDVLASLEEIRGLLGTLPDAEPMPADVADRIDAALADEAQGRTPFASPASTADVSRETEPAVAAKELADRPAGRSRSATGPGRRAVRRRRRNAVLGAALGAAVVSVSVLLLQNVTPSGSSDGLKAADQGVSASQEGSQAFSQSTLEERVHSLLGSRTDTVGPQESGGEKQDPSADTKSSAESTSPTSASPQTPLRAPSVTVPPCIEQGTGRNTAALAIERGTYEGSDAFLVVMPHPTDSTRVQAYVVDAACVGAEPAAKGKLLLTHVYARP
ncbi:anti-sigma factor family protein [Streptomyces sp. NPDC005780]|uniref:anti-sigma factor family protein n=1 Tax=Streptomyces sp. NPDC005780 TaxID=3364730 RepID=UPI0036A9213D